ncbi:unknown [Coprococcus eutactus CAG:665]|nr:unknown [Coprococcus eutactus CAG:665]
MGIGLNVSGNTETKKATVKSDSSTTAEKKTSDFRLVSHLKMYNLTYSTVDESTVNIIKYVIDNIENSELFPFNKNDSAKTYTDLQSLFSAVVKECSSSSMPADYVEDEFLEEPGVRKVEVTKI